MHTPIKLKTAVKSVKRTQGVVERIGSYPERVYGSTDTHLVFVVMLQGNSQPYEIRLHAEDSETRKQTLALTAVGDSIAFELFGETCLEFANSTLAIGRC